MKTMIRRKFSTVLLAGLLAVSWAPGLAADLLDERFDFADGLYSRGMYEMAAGEYAELIRDHPSHPRAGDASFRHAESLYFLKNYAPALAQYRAFLEKFKSHPRVQTARVRVAESLYALGKKTEAEQEFAGLFESPSPEVRRSAFYHSGKIFYEAADWKRAREYFLGAAEEVPGNPYRDYAVYFLGEIALAEGDAAQAAADFLKLTESAREDLKQLAFYGLGRAYFGEENYGEAARNFLRASELAADSRLAQEAFLNLLKTRFNQKDFSGLLQTYSGGEKKLADPAKRIQALFLAARARVQMRDYGEAARTFDAVLNEKGLEETERVAAVIGKAEILMLQSNAPEALKLLEGLPAGDSSLAERRQYLLGEALLKSGDWQKAVAVFGAFETGFPESTLQDRVLLGRAYAFLEGGEWDKARAALRVFLDRFPDHELAPKALRDRISAGLKVRDWKQTVEDSLEFLKRFPESPEAAGVHYRLGAFYTELGDFTASIRVYEEHLEKYGQTESGDEIFFRLGFARQSAGDLEAAVREYSRIDPARVPEDVYYASLQNRAFCHMRLDQEDAAADAYRRMVLDYPDRVMEPGIYFWLAKHEAQKGNVSSMGTVLENFSRGPDANKHSVELEFYRGENARLEKRYEKALLHYAVCLKEEGPLRADAHLGQGLAYAALGRADEAVAALEAAARESGEDYVLGIRARGELANIYYSRGDYLEAAKGFLSVGILYEDPDLVPQVLFRAGEAFEKAGRKDEAVKVYRELTERFPGDALARKSNLKLEELSREN